MADGLTPNLLWLACIIGLLSAWIAWRDLPLSWSIGLGALRIAVPLVYFAWYYDGDWNLLDDLTYFSHADTVLDKGYNPLTVLLDPSGVDLLTSLNGGHHILYSWWNVLAAWLFGSNYYAPVFMNVLASFATGWLLVRTLRKLGLGDSYCKWLLVFFLIHWDTVAWSSFENVKDVLVEFLTAAGLYFAASFFRSTLRRSCSELGSCASCSIGFAFTCPC